MKKLLNVLFAVALTLSVSACGVEIVDTGHRGVETEFGKVVDKSLPEGIYTYNPFTSNIVEMDVRTQKMVQVTQAYTKDVQQATLQYTMNYNLNPDKAHVVFRDVGRDWEEKLIPHIVNGAIKTVTGRWEAVSVVENRQEVTDAIFSQVKANLSTRGVNVQSFEIVDISYAEEFERAVEAKVTAVQRAAEAENKTKQVEEEAKQKVIAATAEAESMRIRANALTQNKALVEYEAVQKWNGVLPTMMMGNGSIPFINMDMAKKQ